MKFTVVTPSLNSEKYIEETIISVISQTVFQTEMHSLEYIICDGGSTDSTLEIIKKYKDYCIIISEPDKSMYDGLAKGLKIATGSIISYLNAGDYYHKTALEVVHDIFALHNVEWLSGYNVIYNDRSVILSVVLPYKFRNDFFRKGNYGSFLPNVQQESVFWSDRLNQTIDFEKLSEFKYAGDFYLWFIFSNNSKLFIVMAVLGGFKLHPKQLSENKQAYKKEMKSIIAKKNNIADKIICLLDFIVWNFTSSGIKKRLNSKQIFKYNVSKNKWDL